MNGEPGDSAPVVPGYTPTSRRPIAEAFRATAGGAVRWCVRWGIHPDLISYASILFAALAGFCFWKSYNRAWLLWIAPIFCYLRLWLNMFDGMVALASGRASKRGELINDLPDRISDVLIFVGVAHSTWCAIASGYWAAIAALLTAYVGLFGQALGAGRQFGGVMSKPWRMVVLHLGAWGTLACLFMRRPARIGPLTVLDWTCLIIVLGCIQTIVIRLRRILASLDQDKSTSA